MKARHLLLGSGLTLFLFSPVHAATLFGSLSNFDCINDTGSDAHGFEIELDGCDASQVYSTFGNPYNRYGTPTVTTVGGNTFVRYEGIYDTSTNAWSATTVSGSIPNGTGGHSLYINSGYPDFTGPNNPVPGDHFGVALSTTPTQTIYHWLLDDGTSSHNLVLAGTNVMVPAPVFQPVAANPAQFQAVVAAPPAPENSPLFGDAIWVKVYTTVVQSADPIELDQLLMGNPAVPGETETEVSWTILQAGPGGGNTEQIDPIDPVGANESVSRRYDFFKYIGGYDPEDHAALHDSYAPEYVGDYLGNQNVAANFAALPEPGSLAIGMGMACMALSRRRRREVTGA